MGEVKFRAVSFALIFPLFLYLGYVMVTTFQGWDPITVSVFLALLAINAIQLVPWKGRWVSLSGLWLLVMGFVLAGLAIGLSGGVGLDLSAAILLASPFLAETWIWQAHDSPGKRVVALQFAFLDGIMIVAALHTLTANQVPVTSGNLVYAFGNVDLTQLRGLYNLLTGSAAYSLPLQSAMDPTLVLLGGLALLGVFAPLLRPETGTGILLPLAPVEESAPMVAYSPEMEMAREETKALFRGRSQAKPPPFSQLPGLSALAASGTVTLAFIYASLEWPSQALLPAFLALAAVLGAVLVAAHSSVRAPPSRAPAPAPSPYGYPLAPGPSPAKTVTPGPGTT